MLSSIHERLRVVLSWSCSLILICSTVPQTALAQSADDDAAVRKLVEKFFDYYQRRDLESLMALWSEKSPEFEARKQEFRQTFATNKLQLRSVTIHKIEVNKDKAKIRAVADINAQDVKTGKAADRFGIINRTFHLLREGESWKVLQYVANEQGLAAALLSAKTDEERKALLAAEKELMTAELVRALVSEGRRLETQGAYSVALDSYEIALNLAGQLQDLIGTASALRGIGWVHYLQGDNPQALEHLQESLKISQEIGDKEGVATSLNNIGNVRRLQGNYTQALEHLQESLKISQEIGNKERIATVLNNIGIVHSSQGNKTQALEYFQESLKISEEIGDKRVIANVLNNIGNVQGNTQALEYYQRSLKIREEIGDKGGGLRPR